MAEHNDFTRQWLADVERYMAQGLDIPTAKTRASVANIFRRMAARCQ